jgi:hypothetical protein
LSGVSTAEITAGTETDWRVWSPQDVSSLVQQHQKYENAAEVEAEVNHDNLVGFVANEHIDWTADQGATNINNANIDSSLIDHDNLTNFVANEHIDWTADQGATNIDIANIDQTQIDHGTIGGLSDDDHTQYLRTDGTRALTGSQSFGDNNATNLSSIEINQHPSQPTFAAGKGYIWVKDTSPTTLFFTDDTGADTDLTAGGGDAWSDAVNSDILPTGADKTYDLGSESARFKELFVSAAHLYSSLDLRGNNFINVGSASSTLSAVSTQEIADGSGTNLRLFSPSDASSLSYQHAPQYLLMDFVLDITVANISTAATGLVNSNGNPQSVDLSLYDEARVTTARGANAKAGLWMGVRFADIPSLTATDYSALGEGGAEVDVDSSLANTAATSDWINIRSEAKGEKALAAFVTSAGGTNTNIARISVELRRKSGG